ncbi:hypothetical protein E2562_001027 [Oryza meyeriana var. granulata]|uniref:Uncharacterized protein n=1 Tax=Oryza meyeriana var. granulata TaxID=110450 RepID=A0A6G1ECV7_9ORYZ|nr:hypothetical protein E2562_001027 [Oryza meyeriana var. granulata]
MGGKRFRETMDALEEDQKGFITKYGFNAFLSLSNFNVHTRLVEWVMQKIAYLDHLELPTTGLKIRTVNYNMARICLVCNLDFKVNLSYITYGTRLVTCPVPDLSPSPLISHPLTFHILAVRNSDQRMKSHIMLNHLNRIIVLQQRLLVLQQSTLVLQLKTPRP